MIRKEFSTSRERRDIKSLRLDNGLDRWIDPDGKTSRLDHFRQCVVQCDDVRVARELYFRQERAQRQGAADVRDKVGEVERGEARIDDLAVHAIGDTAVSGNGCREVFNLERALEPRGEKAAKRRDGARKGAERERVHHEHRATYGGDAPHVFELLRLSRGIGVFRAHAEERAIRVSVRTVRLDAHDRRGDDDDGILQRFQSFRGYDMVRVSTLSRHRQRHHGVRVRENLRQDAFD